jgi:GNAT superfamily N-acetyltransferase
MMDRVIREATRDDAEGIAAMYQGTWPIYWDTPEAVRYQFGVLEAIGGTVLVAVEGKRVVGHCEFIPTREPEPYGFWGYLEAIEVHRDFHRQGIGTALVKEAIGRCEAAGCTRFGTGPDDERSEGLYRKCGMTHVERSISTHFAISGEPPEPAVESVQQIDPSERLWEELLHVLGRSHCPAYWCSMAFRRREAGEESDADSFALRQRIGGGDAAVLYTGSWLHVFLPPDRLEDTELLQSALAFGVRRVKGLGKESFHTLMPMELAEAVRAVPAIFPSESHFHFHMWMPLGEGSSE